MIALWCALALAGTETGGPSDAWRTIRTEHFRVHYPEVAADWAVPAASRLEAWHAMVTEEVGYTPPKTIDVVVRDPLSSANGMALPFLSGPRIELWATPPAPMSGIGELRRWDELLLVHEDTHIVHLSRPSRSPIGALTGRLVGFGPVLRKAPWWVTEGYATVVEGRLTGSGRPNGAFRGAFLEALAREGALPSYAELEGGPRYLSGSYRYLIGSAYLEWLESEVAPAVGASEHPLRDLWARMSSRSPRSFEEAFRGVFRDDPQALYARFCAEATAAALAAEPAAGADARFFANDWGTSRPTVSADGARVAAVVSSREDGAALVVWDTAPDAEAESEWTKAQEKRVARDPADVPDVRPEAFPPHEVARRHWRGWGRASDEPSFLPDGRLVYASWVPDHTGRWRPDLFVWDPDGGRPERITRGADVRSPTPLPDGRWLAVRQGWGTTSIVAVDPATGAVTPWATGADGLLDRPVAAPDGRVAWLAHHETGWYAVIRADGADRPVPLDGVVDLAWGADGALYGVRGGDAGLTLWRLDPEPAPVAADVAVTSLAAGPDALWFGRMHANGVDLRRLPMDALRPAPVDERPPAALPPLPAPAPVTPEPYGAGPVDLRPLIGGAFSTGANTAELGLRAGDPAGRWEWITLGALGDLGGVSGVGSAFALRSLPVELTAWGWFAGPSATGTSAGRLVPGGFAGVKSTRVLTAGGVGAEFGGYVDGESAALTAEFAGVLEDPASHAVWLEARGRTSAGTGWLADATLAAGIGRSWGLLAEASAGLAGGDRVFRLGGVDTSIVAPAARWSWLVAPAFDVDTRFGAAHLRLDGAARTPWGDLFLTRDQVGDRLAGPGSSVFGLRTGSRVPRQPIARLPGAAIDFGLGVRVEDGAGWDLRPGWADLAAWGRVSWTL